MNTTFLVLGIILAPIMLQSANAESFDFEYHTGEVFQIDYELRNANLTRITVDNTIIFNLNSSNGELFLSFPKLFLWSIV